MEVLIQAIEQSLSQVDTLLKNIKKGSTQQVRAADEKELIKATSWAWFKKSRLVLIQLENIPTLTAIDALYKSLLEISERDTSRSKYLSIIKNLRVQIIELRSLTITEFNNGNISTITQDTSPYPNFSKLVTNSAMQNILKRRWDETQACLNNGAPLAATVMMGAMLEALLLSKINTLSDKSPIFKLKSTPINKMTQKPLQLTDWKLKNLIEVSAEMTWIRQPAKEVSVIIRDYRNFIHPERELSSGINIEKEDTAMFWAIFTTLATQIIDSV